MVSRAIGDVLQEQRRFHPGAELPPFSLHGTNRIPLERGLGSSAAAAVAGVALADALLGPAGMGADPLLFFDHASRVEGHPDNAAAAAFGGFTVVADGFVHRVDPHPDLDPVVLVPDHLQLPTRAARDALENDVSRDDAVFNIGHASLAAVAFTQDPGLLGMALRDRLHEDARLAQVPEARELLRDLRRDRGLPACVSGAGPSLLVFEPDGGAVGDLPDGWRAIRPGVRATGVEVQVDG